MQHHGPPVRPRRWLGAWLGLIALQACSGDPAIRLDSAPGDLRAVDGDARATDGAVPTPCLAPGGQIGFNVTGRLICDGYDFGEVLLVLRLRRSAGSSLQAVIGARQGDRAAWLDHSATAVSIGAISQDRIKLSPFHLSLDNGWAQSVNSISVQAFSGTLTCSATGTGLSGTMSGEAYSLTDDILNTHQMSVAISGVEDRTPPGVITMYSSTVAEIIHVLDHPLLGFSEPVLAKPSTTLVRLLHAEGATLASAPFEPGKDPGGAVGHVYLKPGGHLPFDTALTAVVDPAATDLAGNPFGSPASSALRTTSAPDASSTPNPGFETGDLTGYRVHIYGGYADVQVVQGTAGVTVHQGTHAALLKELGRGRLRLSTWVTLPAGAKSVSVALNYLTNSTSGGPDQQVAVSTNKERRIASLHQVLPTSTQPLPSPAFGYTRATGFTSVAVDVAGMAPGPALLTIGDPGRSYIDYPGPVHTYALLIDDIVVK